MIKTLEPIDMSKYNKESSEQLVKDTHHKMKNVYDDSSYTEVVKTLKTQLTGLRKLYKDSRELDLHYIKEYLNN